MSERLPERPEPTGKIWIGLQAEHLAQKHFDGSGGEEGFRAQADIGARPAFPQGVAGNAVEAEDVGLVEFEIGAVLVGDAGRDCRHRARR